MKKEDCLPSIIKGEQWGDLNELGLCNVQELHWINIVDLNL